MSLSLDQGNAVLQRLDADAATTLATVTARRDAGESGFAHGALHIFGADSDSALDAAVGAVRMVQASVDRLRRDLPSAADDAAQGERWISAARAAQLSLSEIDGYQAVATVDAVLSQTFQATVATVKEGAANAASAALSVIPGWAWGAAGLLVVGILVVKFGRRAA